MGVENAPLLASSGAGASSGSTQPSSTVAPSAPPGPHAPPGQGGPPPQPYYGPPQPQYVYAYNQPAPPPPVSSSVVVSLPTQLTFDMGSGPQMCTCPNCGNQGMTRVEKKDGTAVWASAGVLLLLGCCLGCCLIPFCIDDLKDSEHHCMRCNVYLGRRKIL